MDQDFGTAPISASPRIHLRALGLAAALFVLFAAATGLYARYGYAFALRVFEAQQAARSAERVGSGKLIELADYLRVDPGNLRVRGLLVNQWIEFRDAPRALEVARQGLAGATSEQRPIAMLLYARAQIAGGEIDGAERMYQDVLASAGESGEAHYGLAHIAAARGDFTRMRQEYARCMDLLNSWPNSTPDFVKRAKQALWSSEWGTTPPLYADTDDAFFISVAMNDELLGHMGVLDPLSRASDFSGAPPLALVLRGVYEEEQGRPDAALDYYKRAADAGDALGAFAFARLGRS